MALDARNEFAYQQTSHDATSTQQSSHTQPHQQLDTKRAAYFDEDDTVLDPTILDADIMQSPHHHDFPLRKGSFANNSGVLSPADSQGWDAHYPNGLPIDPASAGLPGHFHDDNSGFVRHHSISHVPTYQHHPAGHGAWPMTNGSEHCPPAGSVEMMPNAQAFESMPYVHHRADSAHASFSHPPPPPPFNAPQVETGFISAPQVQTPMSPQSHQDWMALAAQELEARPGPKRMRTGSPPRTILDMQRRDGIRKKNGRIDIPQERNIHTIDELIETTKDEDLLKELKQQKRLLRNREAALASRQRKKKHTEDLEIKEKSFTTQIQMLEQQVNDLSMERDNLARDRQILMHRSQEAERTMEAMHMEKRDMIMKHTEETSSLRKKVQVLTSELEAGPAPAMSAAPSSQGYTDFNAEMEALSMGAHEWDNFIFVNDLHNDPTDEFNFDQPIPEAVRQAHMLEKKASSTTIIPATAKKGSDNPSEQPIASGLLFMLLLCGAFVASKQTISSSAELPSMPPHVRAAAPAVLDNLLAESSATSAGHQRAQQAFQAHQDPAPSSQPNVPLRASSHFDQMHHRITSPSRQQLADEAFALTSSQYAALAGDEAPAYMDAQQGQAQPKPARRTLAEALASMQPPDSGSKADVYTRSLLFDQIPADVVKQFKDMVRDREQSDMQNQHSQHHHQQQFYKTEN